MGARIPLTNALTAGQTSASIQIRLADPPYLFVATGGFTGTVSIQHSIDTMPPKNDGGGVSNSGVSDAAATWITIINTISNGDQVQWDYPLYRVRANATSVTAGSAKVTMLEGIRSLKSQGRDSSRQRQRQLRA